ncbi:hypothetical protein AAVH_19777 [Aphelenchoides avenae]|nr:hypothetical protein AAVH_19777 [Aphelenchus avenae]
MSALVTASSATTPATISKYPRLVALPEQLTFEEAEEACLELRGTVAAPTEPHFEEYLEGLPKQQPHWAVYKDPLGNHTENEEYVDCYAIDSSQKDSAGHSKVLSKSCSEKLPAVCSVADGMKCSSKKELYFNGYCYKHIDELYNATEGEKACEMEGSTLASVHSAGENHAIRHDPRVWDRDGNSPMFVMTTRKFTVLPSDPVPAGPRRVLSECEV